MPLVHWIVQNLSTLKSKGGAVGGGSAAIQQVSFVIATTGSEAGGTAFCEKISDIAFSGGGVSGGNSFSSKEFAYYKKARYLPGDVVYDKCNKSWIVVSFQISSFSEQKLNLTNNFKQKIFFESELSEQQVYILEDRFKDCNKICLFGAIGGKARVVIDESSRVIEKKRLESVFVSNKINSIRNEPLAGLPVYNGKRKVRL